MKIAFGVDVRDLRKNQDAAAGEEELISVRGVDFFSVGQATTDPSQKQALKVSVTHRKASLPPGIVTLLQTLSTAAVTERTLPAPARRLLTPVELPGTFNETRVRTSMRLWYEHIRCCVRVSRPCCSYKAPGIAGFC